MCKNAHQRTFFSSSKYLINWAPIEKELRKVYKRGEKERGCKAYHPLILFKMQLNIYMVWHLGRTNRRDG